MKVQRLRVPVAAAALAAGLAACGGGSNDVRENVRPAFVTGDVLTTTYDGVADDLLTAGLGSAGLQGAAPAVSATPTAAELRRLAIYNNYRALVDVSTNGGYGVLYGPTVDAPAGTTDGKVAGTEVLAFSDDGTGLRNVTLMVQIPASFDRQLPCIITATSSGSRGVYGGIVTGEWGLKHGCAVAYTDKGTGASPHDLTPDTVGLIDGRRATAAAAGASAAFRADVAAAELATFNATTPNRLAYKHAHSQQNPEAGWGTFTLQAIDFAFWALNERYGDPLANGARSRYLTPRNTLVITSSLSNGGAAAIAAAEQDTSGMVDGVAVAEPVLEMPATLPVSVQRGSTTPATFGKPLYDYMSYANLYQPCAALSSQIAAAALAAAVPAAFNAGNRCAALAARGLVTGTTTAEQADDALARMRAYGWEPESEFGHASHTFFQVAPSVTVTFANAHARASVTAKLCGIGFAAVTAGGVPTAMSAAALSTAFSTGNGVPPSAGGVELINELNPAGPLRNAISVSPSTGAADMNLDGALCLRNLLTGTDETSVALQAGIGQVVRNGNLRGKPAIIVHGRADTLVPVNHNSRPYTALNKVVEGANSRLSYVEVTNAQHFEAFIPVAGNDIRFVPLHVYLNRALDSMYAHLRNGTALPPSQVVRTTPRGGTAGAAPAITAANVPPIASAPAAGDLITMNGSTLVVPD